MSRRIVIIDYGAGNLRSAFNALNRAATDCGLEADIHITSKASDVRSADHIILPGVGTFGHCMSSLSALPEMVDTLTEDVCKSGKPFLGICVGMQLLAVEGLESGKTPGLGWINGVVDKLRPSDPTLKIPHMGWNTVQKTEACANHPVFVDLVDGDHVYFVHSYHMIGADDSTALTTHYGGTATAAVAKDTMVGLQFHPEKSQAVGLKLLRNFIQWQP